MGMLVLLVEGEEVTISASTSERLAHLGISSVELLCEGGTTAVVLEGWAFDPHAGRSCAETIAPGRASRTLLPVMRVIVSDSQTHAADGDATPA